MAKKIGDTYKTEVKIEKGYFSEKEQGKTAEFKITINSKVKKEIPKYNVEFIKEVSKYDNKTDYEKFIKKELEDRAKASSESLAKQNMWNTVVEKSNVTKYPKDILKLESEKIIQQYKDMAKQNNTSYKKFLKDYMSTTEEEFSKQSKTYAKNTVKQKLIVYAIADKEDMNISKSEYEKRLKDMLKKAEISEKQFESQYSMTLEEYGEKNDFMTMFTTEDVQNFIYKNGKPITNK